jgi:hypothetical protein
MTMNRTPRRILLATALLALTAGALAQTPPPAPRAPGHGPGRMHDADGYMGRLDKLLREAREKRQRVVLRSFGEEVAGQVVDHGPGWVVLSNQEGQQILLQTHSVERAEIR